MGKRYVVTPDKHFPYHNKESIKILCKVIEIVKPDGYIDLGDTGEWENASHWRWKGRSKPALEWYLPGIIQDVEDVNKGMDIIDEALLKVNCKEKHFVEGNHDMWMNMFVKEYPYLPQYSIPKALKLKDRGYTYHKAGDLLQVGNLHFYHGHNYGGIHHARNHLNRYKCNIMYGHHHDVQVATDTSTNGPIQAWSIGCLKNDAPEVNQFTKGRPLNWIQAFAIVDYYNKNDFSVNLVQIHKGKAIIFGKEINASTK